MASGLGDIFEKSLRTFLKPLMPYWDDPAISGIFINGPEDIWVEGSNGLSPIEEGFSIEHLNQAIRHISQLSGVLVNEDNPHFEAILPDGSEISVILPPLSRQGPVVAIQKANSKKSSLDELVMDGFLSPAGADCLEAALLSQQSILIVGPPASGTSSLLRALLRRLSSNERLVSIESGESKPFPHPHVLRFGSSDDSRKARSEITRLLQTISLLRPHRLILENMDQTSAKEAIQVLQKGFPGSLASVRGCQPLHAFQRLESLSYGAGYEGSMQSLRAQIASAFQVIAVCQRTADGTQRVIDITESLGVDERGDYRFLPLFQFADCDTESDDQEAWRPRTFLPTGALPSFWSLFRQFGFEDLDRTFFHPANYDEYGQRLEDKMTETNASPGEPLGRETGNLSTTLPSTELVAALQAMMVSSSGSPNALSTPVETQPAATPKAKKAPAIEEPAIPVKGQPEPSVQANSTKPTPVPAPSSSLADKPPTPKPTPSLEDDFPKSIAEVMEDTFNSAARQAKEAPPSHEASPTPPAMPAAQVDPFPFHDDDETEPPTTRHNEQPTPSSPLPAAMSQRELSPPKETIASPVVPSHSGSMLDDPLPLLPEEEGQLSPFSMPDSGVQAHPSIPDIQKGPYEASGMDAFHGSQPTKAAPIGWENGASGPTTAAPSFANAQPAPAGVEDTSQVLDLSDIIDEALLEDDASHDEFQQIEQELRQQPPVQRRVPSTEMHLPNMNAQPPVPPASHHGTPTHNTPPSHAAPATRAGMLPHQSPSSVPSVSYSYTDEEPTHSGSELKPEPPPNAAPPTLAPMPSSPPPPNARQTNPHTPKRSVVVRRGRRNTSFDGPTFSGDNDSTSIRAKPPSVPQRQRPTSSQENMPASMSGDAGGNHMSTDATVIRGRPVRPKK